MKSISPLISPTPPATPSFDTNAIISTIQGKVGVTFTGACISGERLYELVSALQGYDATQVDAMLGLIGTYPELEAPLRQCKLNESFTAVKTALQATPASYPQTELNAYKTAIQEAFGVTLSEESGAQVWAQPDRGGIALHFARLGLEAVADAFERWATAQIAAQELCYTVNKFALFQRVMGQMTFRNIAEVGINFARSQQKLIEVLTRPNFITYYRYGEGETAQLYPTKNADGTDRPPPAGLGEPDGLVNNLPQYDGLTFGTGQLVSSGNQAIMTPNNLIHELGHSLSRFAGYTTASDRGTMEYAIAQAALPYTEHSRKGMGELFLQQYFKDNPNSEYYEHATIQNNNGLANFVASALPPSIATPEQREIYYLLYDLLGENQYPLWDSPQYNPYIFGGVPRARIDFHVHNPAQTALETSADAFLNWVRNKLSKLETTDPDWSAFFQTNLPIFLRNGVLFNQGSLAHYQRKGYVTQPVASGNVELDYRLRITAEETSFNMLGRASDPDIGLYQQTAQIYGWTDRVTTPEDDSPHWLLVSDIRTRLLWIASDAIPTISGSLDASNKINDPSLFYLDRPYESDDLQTILGV